MGKSIIPNEAECGNKTFDITVPWTNDFLEAQKVVVIVSSLLNLSSLQMTNIK